MNDIPPVAGLNPENPIHSQILQKRAYEADPIAVIRAGMLSIKTKSGELVSFELNSSQQRIVEAIQKQRRLGIPVRIVVLKSRQMGTSTLSEAIVYAFCSLRGVSQGLVLADDEEGASDIFKMNETFYGEMQRQYPYLTPNKTRSDEKRMEFFNTKSGIRIETARNKRAGRKYTYRYAHLTEVAFYEDLKTLLAGLLPSVPDQPETIIILETTANGMNYFAEFWNQKKKAFEEGRTEWIPIFLPWSEHEEYVRPFYDEHTKERFIATLTTDEKRIMKVHRLTFEQMNWRRHQITDTYSGDQDKFEVEYPLTDREAFKSTSKRIFPERIVAPQLAHVIDPKFRGEMEIVGRRPSLIPDPQGFLKIYKEVQPDWQYVMGVDSCESALSHDEACIQVVARQTWEQVAHFHGHIAPDELARKAFAMGQYYNFAFIAPERNGPGAVTVQQLAEMAYPNLCRTQRSVITDGGKWIDTEEFGFHTNARTKPDIINKLSASLRDLLLVIHDAKTIDQLSTFVVKKVNEEGHVATGAEEGHYDDCVMALAISVWYAHQLPVYRAHQEVMRPSFMSSSRSGYG